MKTIYSYLLLLLFIPGMAMAGIVKGKFTKDKKINRAYTVNNNAALQVANKYGNIVITTWDEDRTEIEVIITVSGNNEDDVTKRLNSIDVDFEAAKALVSAKTRIGSFKGRNINMEINYTIKMPKNGVLGLNNQYGEIRLGKIYGGMNVDCKYGSLNIDEANAENNNIDIQYCSGSRITYIKAAQLKMQYSNVNITKAGKLMGSAQYTPVKIGDVGDISMSIEYGDININTADKVNLKADYTGCRFGRIDNLLNIGINYGDLDVNSIAPSARNIVVNSTYGGTRLGVGADTGFTFEFSTEYGGLNGKELLKFTEKTEKDFSAHYKGSSIRGNGQCKIYAKAEYGDIKISRN